MMPYLQDLDIECWRFAGRLGKNEPTLCVFTSNPESCAPLMLAIDELAQSGPPARRSVTFRSCRRPRGCSRLRLLLAHESDELRRMQISVDGCTATIEMTIAGLEQLRDAVTAWRNGGEDFGIYPNWKRNRRRELGEKDLASGELWFWGPSYEP